jgi:prolipoprotein diacylglyceryl transferase
MMMMNLLLAIHWDASPEIFSLGPFSVRWYGLLFAASFLVGQSIALRMFQAENRPERDLDTLTIYMVVATILGARLGHCLFYDPDYYLANPLKILKVWEGGLASHGAAVGILAGIWLFARKHPGYTFLWVVDRVVVVVALAACLVRFGNLMNSEIVGMPTDLPWAFVFEQAGSLTAEERLIPRHPAQLYESLSSLVLFGLLMWFYWKRKPRPGFLFGVFLVWVFVLRFCYEFLKENQVAFEDGLQASLGLNMGQILSVPMVALGLFILNRSFSQPREGA